MNAIYPIAMDLFWALATIDLTWTCITLVLQHTELQPWMAGFYPKDSDYRLFAVLLTKGKQWVAASSTSSSAWVALREGSMSVR
jgi:hypothetical protein